VTDVSPLPLVLAPEQVLYTRCPAITELDDDLILLAQRMVATMYLNHGIGLAAPQVGRSVRLIVVDCTPERLSPMVAFNPTILWRQGQIVMEEGCLSFPGETFQVKRAARIGVAFMGLDGKHHQGTAEGLWAVCIQHEIDHLDGVTFDQRAKGQRVAGVEPGGGHDSFHVLNNLSVSSSRAAAAICRCRAPDS